MLPALSERTAVCDGTLLALALSELRADGDDVIELEMLTTAEAVASKLSLPVCVADTVSALVDDAEVLPRRNVELKDDERDDDTDDVRVVLALAALSSVLAAVTVGKAEALAASVSLVRADTVNVDTGVGVVALGEGRAVTECCTDGEWVVDALVV